jgi:hypothetical protein
MESQLVTDYLSSPDCRDGIYLVAWFDGSRWDAEDYRKNRVPKWTIERAREVFDSEAERLSAGERLLRAFVLDCSY